MKINEIALTTSADHKETKIVNERSFKRGDEHHSTNITK